MVVAAVQALNNIDIRDNVVDVAVVEMNGTALNNFLTGSPILSDNDVTIGAIHVLTLEQIAILEDANIVLSGASAKWAAR